MKADYIVGLLVAATLALISTVVANFMAVTRIDYEIQHIDENVDDIRKYWEEWQKEQQQRSS